MGSAMEKTMTIDQLKVGQIHQSSVTITADMIKRFAMELLTDQFSQSIDMRLKYLPYRDSADLPTSVRIIA